MKKHFLLSIAIVCFVLVSCGQSLKRSDVPAAVVSVVESKYPNLSYKWEKEDGDYEASFKQNGKEVSVVVNAAGMILETETEISVSELPAAAMAYMKEHYNGQKIRDAAKIMNKEGVVTYEAALKSKDIIFDSNGAFLKESAGD